MRKKKRSILKNGTNELIYKTETESQVCKKQTYGNWEERGRGMTWEVETDIYILLYIK